MTTALLCALVAILDFGGPGTSALPLLQVGQGVRAAALGESYVGRAADASALYWNPAGLGRVERYHLAVSHHEWFGGIRDELIQLAFPGRAGAFALGMLYSGEPGIEYWSPSNTPGDSFSTWSALLNLGYGATFAHRWRLGVGVKGFFNSLHTTSGYGGALDIGLGVRPTGSLQVGLVGRNLGLIRYGSTLHDLPAEAALGAEWTAGPFNIGADVVVPLGRDVNIRAGVEYRPVDMLALRLGYRTGPAGITGLGWFAGISGGLGLSLGPVQLDYAITPQGALGLIHRVGLDFNFERKGAGSVLIQTVTGVGLAPLHANLAFEGVHSGTATTDRLGRCRIDGLLPGRLIIRTSLPGYAQRVDTMHILGTRQQLATISLSLLDYGSMWVAIYDASTMQAIGGTVGYSGPIYGEQEVPTTPGSAAIRDVPVGRYVLSVSGPNRQYYPASCTLDVQAGAVTERRVLLSRGGRVSQTAPAGSVTPTTQTPTETLVSVPLTFASIIFAEGSAALPAGTSGQLDVLSAALVSRPGAILEISGHTDDREPLPDGIDTRLDLARARAESIRDYLVAHGTDADRLIARGYADTQPVAGNDTEDGRARNRRVEFFLIEE